MDAVNCGRDSRHCQRTSYGRRLRGHGRGQALLADVDHHSQEHRGLHPHSCGMDRAVPGHLLLALQRVGREDASDRDDNRRAAHSACSVPDPVNDTVVFSTDSDNYCPQLLDELSSSAALTSYQNPAMTQPQVCGSCRPEVWRLRSSLSRATLQDQFVFGTTVYFEAVITSAVVLQNVHIVVRIPTTRLTDVPSRGCAERHHRQRRCDEQPAAPQRRAPHGHDQRRVLRSLGRRHQRLPRRASRLRYSRRLAHCLAHAARCELQLLHVRGRQQRHG
jgi:hypothetical protein